MINFRLSFPINLLFPHRQSSNEELPFPKHPGPNQQAKPRVTLRRLNHPNTSYLHHAFLPSLSCVFPAVLGTYKTNTIFVLLHNNYHPSNYHSTSSLALVPLVALVHLSPFLTLSSISLFSHPPFILLLVSLYTTSSPPACLSIVSLYRQQFL